MNRHPSPHRPGPRPQWYAPPSRTTPSRTRTLALAAALGTALAAAAVLLAEPILQSLGVAVFLVLLLTGNASS